MGRSILQTLRDRFRGTGVEDLLDNDEIDEIDDLLRAAAPETAPVPETMIPPGLSDRHWWWHLPRGPAHELDESDF